MKIMKRQDTEQTREEIVFLRVTKFRERKTHREFVHYRDAITLKL